MTSAKSLRLVGLVAVASLVFAACGAAATPAPSAEPSAAASSAPSEAPASTEPGALPAPELATVKIGFSNTEMTEFAPVLAEKLGIFEKYGVKAELLLFEGDGKVMAALQAGQIDVGYNGVSSAVSSQLTDAPTEVIGVNGILLTDDIVCQGTIKSVADVTKETTVAISTFGGTSNGAALLGLKALGLSAQDATITQVGGQKDRIAALEGGSVDCAVVDTNKQATMIEKGFSILVELKKAGIAWGRAGMNMTKEWVAKNPNTALVLLAGTLEAQQLIWTSPDVATTAYASWTEQDNETARAQIDDFQIVGNQSLQWPDDAFANPRKVIAMVNPDIIDVPIEDAFDRSFIQTLIDNGFYDKVGAPHS